MSVVELSKINFDDLKFAPNKSSSKRIFMKLFYNKKPFIFKIPRTKIPFNSQKNNYGQLEICLSIPSKLSSYFNNLDKKIKELLNEEKPDNNYEFSPSLKSSNPNFDPLFKFKIFKTEDKLPNIFDKDKEPINVSTEDDLLIHFKKRNEAICAIECGGLWAIEGRCGLSFKLIQGRVFNTDNIPQDEDYAFDDSDSSVSDYLFDD